MRIIGGSARGRRLTPPKGDRLRPTADRVKEALFNILASRLGNFSDIRLLDLFSGSGALGIEALSRGAERVVFVDNHQDSAALTRKNLELSGFASRGRIICRAMTSALSMLSSEGCSFHIVLLDPPYSQGLAEETITALAGSTLLTAEALVIAETAKGETLPEEIGQLHLMERRCYGDTALTIYTVSTDTNGEER